MFEMNDFTVIEEPPKSKECNVPCSEHKQWRRFLTIAPAFLMSLFSLKYYVSFSLDQPKRSVACEACHQLFHGNQEQPVSGKLLPMIDIISVGSLLKESFQDAQNRTFGGHSLVRNFFRITERSDFDQECFTELTNDQIGEVKNFCKKGNTAMKKFGYRFRTKVFNPKNNAGWMCAQKRPIDGLHKVLQQYKDGSMELPEYLFVIDDDTYLNMDTLSKILFNDFPAESPNVVSGCVFDFFGGLHFPYGGFGSFLSRASIQRLLQPINCNETNADGVIADPFTRHNCGRLQKNLIGERNFFVNGMSVADLMHSYSSSQSFTEVGKWKTGYCFHSDHALAYFFNMYHIAVPDSELEGNLRFTESLRKTFTYQALTNTTGSGRKGECGLERDKCTADSPVCHYIVPSQMDALFGDLKLTRVE